MQFLQWISGSLISANFQHLLFAVSLNASDRMVTLQKYFVVLSLVFGQTVCVKVNILSPKTSDSVNVAVIIVPGASITGEAYQPLGLCSF